MTDLPRFYGQSGLNVETYDAFHRRDPGGVSIGDLTFYESIAGQAGGPVLELACGTGRVALHLANAGSEVIGLDISEPMLTVAREKLAAREWRRLVPPTFAHGDMADFDLDREFGVVIVAFRSFQALLTPATQRSCLAAIGRHLRPGGLAVIDLFDPILDLLIPDVALDTVSRHRAVDMPGGNRVEVDVVARTNDPVSQVLRETWRFAELEGDGSLVREELEELTMRWSYRFEMGYLFELTGLEVINEFSDFKRSPPAYGHEQIWLVRRP